MQLATPARTIQRVPCLKSAPAAGVTQGPAVIQRQVIEGEDQGGKFYYSDLSSGGKTFREKKMAEDLEEVILEYKRLSQLVQGKMAGINPTDLARIQRVKPSIFSSAPSFNSWVPPHCRDDKTVISLHNSLCEEMKKKQNKMPALPSMYWKRENSEWEKITGVLVEEGFHEAKDLLDKILYNEPQFSLGYKAQLDKHLKEFLDFKLVKIEPEYGIAKKSTKRKSRADSKTVIGSSQSTQEHFIPTKSEKSRKILTDVKKGYQDEEKHAPSFLGEFKQYAGTAVDPKAEGTVFYGGLENTQSSPTEFHYHFPEKVPEWIQKRLPEYGQEARESNPKSFPGGLFLNNKQILPSLPPQTINNNNQPSVINSSNQQQHTPPSPNLGGHSLGSPSGGKQAYRQRASEFINKVYNVLLEITGAQIDYVDWEDWDGDFNSWKRHVLKLTNGWVTEKDVI